MAEMRVVMTLSLSDLASGPLGKFMAQLEALQQAAADVNAEFAAVGKASGGIGSSMRDAAVVGTEAMETVAAAATETGVTIGGVSKAIMNRMREAMTAIAAASTASADDSVAAFERIGGGASSVNRYMVARWQRGMDAMAASTLEAGDVIQEKLNALGLTAAEESARLDAVIAKTMADLKAAQSYANDVVANGPRYVAGGSVGVGAARNTAGEIADFGVLDGIMRKTAGSAEDLAVQESALDRLQQAGMLSAEEYGAALDALNAEEEALGLQVQSTTDKIVEQDVAMKGGRGGGRGFRFHGYYGTISQGLNALMSPEGALVGAFAAIGLGAAYAQSRIDNLTNAVVATGNASGIAASDIDSWAAHIGASISTVDDAQTIFQQLAGSGQIAGEALHAAGDAAVRLAQATGEADSAAANQVLHMETSAAAVQKLNNQFHFLSAAQLAEVNSLFESGNAAQGAATAFDALDAHLKASAAQAHQTQSAYQRLKNVVEEVTRRADRPAGGYSLHGQLAHEEEVLKREGPGSLLHYAAPETERRIRELRAEINAPVNDAWHAMQAGLPSPVGRAALANDVRLIRDQVAARHLMGNAATDYERSQWSGLLGEAKPGTDAYATIWGHIQALPKAKLVAQRHLKRIHEEAAKVGTWFDSTIGAAGHNLHAAFAPVRTAMGAVEHADRNSPAAIRAKYAGYAALLRGWGMPAMASHATALGEHLANKAGYKSSTHELSKLQAQLRAEESVIAARVQVGAITKLHGEQQDLALQRQIAPAMEKAAEAAKKYAQALKDPTLIASMDAMLAKIRAMGTSLNETQKSIQRTFQGATQTFLQQFMLGRTTWRNMFMALNNNIMGGINKSIAQSLSQSFTGWGSNTSAGSGLLGLFGSGSSSGGGFLSGLGSWFSTMFGGSNSFFPSFAVGIDKVPSDMVAQIHQGEMILPAHVAGAVRSGGLGHQVIQNINVNTIDSQSFLGALQTVAREASQLLGSTTSSLNLAG